MEQARDRDRRITVTPGEGGTRCPYCRDALAADQAVLCDSCHTGLHLACAAETTRCTTYGCQGSFRSGIPPEVYARALGIETALEAERLLRAAEALIDTFIGTPFRTTGESPTLASQLPEFTPQQIQEAQERQLAQTPLWVRLLVRAYDCASLIVMRAATGLLKAMTRRLS